eukprot:TRINITY_DN243_c0_g1_i1.p1 TRINITY_DN243_c0_g1~~TRINITY_DN243_c0_g1_i1.p1  ORF type:complete len:140 (-),score=47.16 TRINITY_DN243_c0_g1_i1:64-483(-)
MPLYELTSIAKTNLSKIEFAKLLKKYGGMIVQNGGVIRKMQDMGDRPMEYSMTSHGTKHEEGRYFLMEFEASPFVVQEINFKMRTDDQLVRWLLLKRPQFEKSYKPSRFLPERLFNADRVKQDQGPKQSTPENNPVLSL